MKMKFNFIILLTALIMLTACSNKSEDNIILMPVKNDPTVSIKIWFKVGSQNDPEGKEGLASLTAAMLSDGATINNSYEDILEKLFPLASGYNCNSSTEMTIYSGRTHVDNIDEYYPLFVDGFLNPAFEETDFNRLKDETLNYLKTNL